LLIKPDLASGLPASRSQLLQDIARSGCFRPQHFRRTGHPDCFAGDD